MSDSGSKPGQSNRPLLNAGGKVDRDALYALYTESEGNDESPITVRFELTRDLDKRLDKYLVDRIPFLSRTSLQCLIKEEAVTVNDRTPKASTRLHRGDVVVAVLPPPPSSEIPSEQLPLDILYEDEHLIVLNKQDDIIVHPARGNKSGTLINGLSWHFQHRSSGQLSTVGEEFARPGVVHRLDRHTTGAIVFAKSETAHWRLAHQFERRTTEKRYLAVVHGRLEPHADVIDMPLGKHPTVREKYAVRWDDTGKEAVTIYRVREKYDKFSLVEVELKTGRTHQIRVHLAHMGYPLAGDDIYGGKRGVLSELNSEIQINRQALHATYLGFTHPISNQKMEFTAPLPNDIYEFISQLRNHSSTIRTRVSGAVIDLDQLLQRT